MVTNISTTSNGLKSAHCRIFSTHNSIQFFPNSKLNILVDIILITYTLKNPIYLKI